MLETLQIETAGEIHQAVIWLHGLGADGHDFAPIVSELGLPHTRFIFPHAPYRPISFNDGYEMRAWFDIYGLGGADKQDVDGMQKMLPEVIALIQTQLSQGIPSHRIALAGFSQGGAMAALTALSYDQPLAGLMMLSSYLPNKHWLIQHINPANQAMPTMLTHGTMDNIIVYAIYQDYRQLLQNTGLRLESHEYAMGHQVCDQEIADIRTFLQTIFSE